MSGDTRLTARVAASTRPEGSYSRAGRGPAIYEINTAVWLARAPPGEGAGDLRDQHRGVARRALAGGGAGAAVGRDRGAAGRRGVADGRVAALARGAGDRRVRRRPLVVVPSGRRRPAAQRRDRLAVLR